MHVIWPLVHTTKIQRMAIWKSNTIINYIFLVWTPHNVTYNEPFCLSIVSNENSVPVNNQCPVLVWTSHHTKVVKLGGAYHKCALLIGQLSRQLMVSSKLVSFIYNVIFQSVWPWRIAMWWFMWYNITNNFSWNEFHTNLLQSEQTIYCTSMCRKRECSVMVQNEVEFDWIWKREFACRKLKNNFDVLYMYMYADSQKVHVLNSM